MDPMSLQKQLRDNANDLKDFCKDLKQWSNEMKMKEANKNQLSPDTEVVEEKADCQKMFCGAKNLNKVAGTKQKQKSATDCVKTEKKMEVETIAVAEGAQKNLKGTPVDDSQAGGDTSVVYSSFRSDKSGSICLIQPVTKTIMQRSKVPLRRIKIVETV